MDSTDSTAGGVPETRVLKREEADGPAVIRLLRQSGLVSAEDAEKFEHLLGVSGDTVETRQMIARELYDAGALSVMAGDMFRRQPSLVVVGGHLILGEIGRGGMGVVYRARHVVLGRDVALKMISLSGEEEDVGVQRFRREARVAASLDHPNIVRAYDAGQDGDRWYLSMELLSGDNLHERVDRDGPMSIPKAVDCVRQAAAGLEHAHQNRVVHRDVKPSNLMLTDEGLVKVLDLGLSRIQFLRDAAGSQPDALTSGGRLMGTATFMAPEQAQTPQEADARTDAYGLGCSLHYLLVGRPPFEGGGQVELLFAHRDRPAPDLREARPDVPHALAELYGRMLEKDPDMRPGSCGEIVKELEWIAEAVGPTGDSAETIVLRSPGPRGRRRRWLGFAAVLAVVASVSLLVLKSEFVGWITAAESTLTGTDVPPAMPLRVGVENPIDLLTLGWLEPTPIPFEMVLRTRRLDDRGGLIVGLPMGEDTFLVLLDRPEPSGSRTTFVGFLGNRPAIRIGDTAAFDADTEVRIRVRSDGVTVVQDGSPMLEWSGNVRSLTLAQGWVNPEPGSPFLATRGGGFEVSEVSLGAMQAASGDAESSVVTRPLK